MKSFMKAETMVDKCVFYKIQALNRTTNFSLEIIDFAGCNITKITTANSIWQCAKQCLEWLPKCFAVSFDNATNECRLAGSCSVLYLLANPTATLLAFSIWTFSPSFHYISFHCISFHFRASIHLRAGSFYRQFPLIL